jgi:hypothetical protein
VNPFAFITILNPGSCGPQVGEISTFGSANAVKTVILASPKIPKANTAVVNANLLIWYIIIQGIIRILVNKNFGN